MMKSFRKWNKDIEEIDSLITEYAGDNLLLNELIFTRIISAFEILTIEALKDIFLFKPKLLQGLNKKTEFHYGELLSYQQFSQILSKVINSETRQLSSAGFKEVIKFYRKIGIELEQISPGVNRLNELHDIRHLIVHRLGQVDEMFKKNYNYHDNKIAIDKKFLNDSLADFIKFTTNLEKLITNSISVVEKRPKIKRRYTIKIKITYDNISKYSVLYFERYALRDDQRMVFLSDILVSKEISDNEVILVLKSRKSIIDAYIDELSIASDKNLNFNFEIIEKRKESKGIKKRNIRVDIAVFHQIEDFCENKYIDKELKLEIQEKFSISMTEVHNITAKIMQVRKRIYTVNNL